MPDELSYLAIDTETTGLRDFTQRADAPGQPRLAAFAAIALDPDLEEEGQWSFLVKPDDWVMTPEAQAVHGLSTERLMAEGVPVAQVLDLYEQHINKGRVVIAYNAQFDTSMLRGELRRAGRDDMFQRTQSICVMRGLAKTLGRRWLDLAEACRNFNIPYQGHSAIADASAAAEIARRLLDLGLLPAPNVYPSARHE